MTRVMAVTFEPRGQLHYLDPGAESYSVGDWVLYPTDAGSEVAQVVWAPQSSEGELLPNFGDGSLPQCVGRADQSHIDRDAVHRRVRARAELLARSLISDHGLDMKVVAVDYLDGPDASGKTTDQLVVIYYTAATRVDFRELVPELAAALQCRVDLRQIGDRDAARVIGGIGSCGRDLCCATFLTTIEPVSMRVAKDQQLPANPMQIAGACGRLKCCLTYEHPLYRDFADRAPSLGSRVESDVGTGRVVSHSVPDQSLKLRTDSGEMLKCPLSAVCADPRRRDATPATGETR